MANILIPDLLPNTQYVIEVRAVRATGTSEWSNRKFFTTVSDTVLPLTPTNVTWAVSGDTFAGSWDTISLNVNNEVITIVRYEVELVANSLTRIISVNQTTAGTIYYNLSFEDNRQLFGSPQPTVQMRVRAVSNIDTKSAWSAPLSVSNPVPGNPTSVVATGGSNQIGLTWVAPSDTDIIGYNVYFGAVKQTFVNATSWTYYTTNYSPTTLTVKAVDKFNQESSGAASNSTSAINPSVVDTTAPNTPTGLTGTITNNSNGIGAIAALSWTMTSPPSDLAGYYVRYRRVGDTNYQSVTFAKDALTGSVELNSAYTNYEFQIKAFDWSNNESAWSTTLTVTSPSNAAPANVTGMSSTAGKDSITYSWTPVADTDIKNYEVTFSTSATFASGNTTFLTGTSTSLTVGGLTTNTTYYARVRAVDTGGNTSAGWSSTDTRTTGVFPTANSIVLTSTTQVLTSPSGGGATTPTTATVTGTATGTTITTYDYSVDGAAFSTTVPAGVSRTGNVVTITGSTMTARTIAVRMSDGSISDTLTVAKNFDGATGSTGGTGPAGADAYTVLLTNEAQTIAAGTTNANAGTFTTNVNAYKGSVAQTVTVGTITGGATGITATITNNNTTNPLITFTVTTALTTANGSFTIPVTVAGITFTQIWTWSLSFTGAQGSTGPTGPASDGIVPAAAGAPSVIGRFNSLYVVWSPVTLNNSGGAQNDPVTYEVHLSTTTGFTPSGATKVTEVSGTSAMISNLPGTTTALSYGTTYYIKIISKDRDGSAAASTQGSGSISKVASTDVTSIGADLIVPGTGFVNALVVNTGGSIQSSNYVAATTGWKIAPTGIEMNDNGSTIKADAIKAGTLGGAGGSGVIQIATGTSLVLNGGYLKSNTYTGTAYNSGATAGFYLGNDGLVIAQGTVKAEAFSGGTFTAGTINMGAGGSITGGSWTLNSSGLTIPNGAINAAALNLQLGNNIMPPLYADFEGPSSYYPTNLSNGGSTTSAISTTQVYNNTQSLYITNSAGAARSWYLGASTTDYNIKLDPSTRYIVSVYVYNTTGASVVGSFSFKQQDAAFVNSSNVTITNTAAWTRYSGIVTTSSTATSGVLVFNLNGNGTMYLDAIQVERALNATVTAPSAWAPPTYTRIDGGQIRTGSIQSTGANRVWDAASGTYIAGTGTAWSIATTGAANFSDVVVNGSIVVGDVNDQTNSAKYVVGSAFYVPGSTGWIMRGDGWVEFNQVVAQSISGQAIKANTLTVDRLSSGSLGADIDVVGGGGISIFKSGDDPAVAGTLPIIKMNPSDGLVIDPPGTGYISVPAVAGQPIQIKDVSLTATDADFAGNIKIRGTNNYISGDLAMEKSISNPIVAPTVADAWGEPGNWLQAQGLPGAWYTYRLGNFDSTRYMTNLFNGSDARIWLINKTSGAMSEWKNVTSTIPRTGLSYEPSTQVDMVAGVFHITISAVDYIGTLVRKKAWSYYQAAYTDPYGRTVPAINDSRPAQWYVMYYRASDGANSGSWAWSGNVSDPSAVSDGTYVYIAGQANNTVWTVKFDNAGNFVSDYAYGNFTTTASASAGVYIGTADFGSSKVVFNMPTSMTVIPAAASSADQSSTYAWSRPGSGNATGLHWDGSKFMMIFANGFIGYHSTNTAADTAVTFKYSWYDTDNTNTGVYNADRGNYKHMSYFSPSSSSITHKRRGWTKVTIPTPIPDSGGIDDPDSVKIFANGIPQPDLAVAVTSTIYGALVTSTPVGEIIPTRNEFDDVSSSGKIVSKKTDSRGALITLNGDGSGRIGPVEWDNTGGLVLWPVVNQVLWSGGSFNVGSTTAGAVGDAISFTSPGPKAVYIASMTIVGIAPNGVVNFNTLNIDGSSMSGMGGRTHSPNNGAYFTVTRTLTVTGLSAGTHSLAVWSWNNAAGTTQILSDSTLTLTRIM